MLNVVCPNCKSEFDVAEQYAGKRAKCAKCGTRFVLAGGNTPVAPLSPVVDPLAELFPPEQSWQPVNWATSSQPAAAKKAGTYVPQAGLILNGRQGKSVIVDGATIRITKKAGPFSAEREKTFPIRNISSVEVKKPGVFVAGFIQFSIAGGAARNSSYTITGGAFDAAQDENSVLFLGQEKYQIALKIKNYVETYRETAPPASTLAISAADEILKLKALMDQGIITPDEFETKKRRLIES
jgi:predicted Zn finger-like uncharacterized protein